MTPPNRMRLLEAIEVLPSDALLPVAWVRTLLAQAVNAKPAPTEHKASEEIGRPGPSGGPSGTKEAK